MFIPMLTKKHMYMYRNCTKLNKIVQIVQNFDFFVFEMSLLVWLTNYVVQSLKDCFEAHSLCTVYAIKLTHCTLRSCSSNPSCSSSFRRTVPSRRRTSRHWWRIRTASRCRDCCTMTLLAIETASERCLYLPAASVSQLVQLHQATPQLGYTLQLYRIMFDIIQK